MREVYTLRNVATSVATLLKEEQSEAEQARYTNSSGDLGNEYAGLWRK